MQFSIEQLIELMRLPDNSKAHGIADDILSARLKKDLEEENKKSVIS